MNKLIELIKNPWVLFTLGILSFSLSCYALTELFVIWGVGFIVAFGIRMFERDSMGDVRFRR